MSTPSGIPRPATGVADNGSYLLRWRGRQEGPCSLAAVEQKLAANEIGLLHEIFADGQWHTLRDFLAQQEADRVTAQLARAEAERQAQLATEEAAKLRAEGLESQRLLELKRQNDLIEKHQQQTATGTPAAIPGAVGTTPYVRKSRGIFIALGLFLGGLGIHNFYAGYYGRGIGQLGVFLLGAALRSVDELGQVRVELTIIPAVALLLWVLVELIVVKQDSNGIPFQ